jgi:hypothetical protein
LPLSGGGEARTVFWRAEWTVSCIDGNRERCENRTMPLIPITNPDGDPGAGSSNGAWMQPSQKNEEFARWRSRWRSRLHRIAAKTSQVRPRKVKIEKNPTASEINRKPPMDAEFKRYL